MLGVRHNSRGHNTRRVKRLRHGRNNIWCYFMGWLTNRNPGGGPSSCLYNHWICDLLQGNWSILWGTKRPSTNIWCLSWSWNITSNRSKLSIVSSLGITLWPVLSWGGSASKSIRALPEMGEIGTGDATAKLCWRLASASCCSRRAILVSLSVISSSRVANCWLPKLICCWSEH